MGRELKTEEKKWHGGWSSETWGIGHLWATANRKNSDPEMRKGTWMRRQEDGKQVKMANKMRDWEASADRCLCSRLWGIRFICPSCQWLKKWYKKVPRALNMDGVMNGNDWLFPSPRGASRRVSCSRRLGEAGEGSAWPGWETFWFWRSPPKPLNGEEIKHNWRNHVSRVSRVCLTVVSQSTMPKVPCLHQDRWQFRHWSSLKTKHRIFWPLQLV